VPCHLVHRTQCLRKRPFTIKIKHWHFSERNQALTWMWYVSIMKLRTRFYRIVSSDASVNEVKGPGIALLVFRLEVVCREEGRSRGGADCNVRQDCIF
jgi:hypothetical protein